MLFPGSAALTIGSCFSVGVFFFYSADSVSPDFGKSSWV